MMVCGIFALSVYLVIVITFVTTKSHKKNSEQDTLNGFADTAIIARNQMRNYSPMFDLEGTIEEQRKRGI